jgi:hypothetical protein
MDAWGAWPHRFLRGKKHGQKLILYPDQLQRLARRLLVYRRYRRHLISDIAHLVNGQRELVSQVTQSPVFYSRRLLSRDHSPDPSEFQGPARIDMQDAGMRIRAAQDASYKHPWQDKVIGEFGFPRNFGYGVN